MFKNFESQMATLAEQYETLKKMPTKYNNDLINNIDDCDSKYISKINDACDIQDMKNILMKTLSEKKIIKEIYSYQLKNPVEQDNKIDDTDKLIDFILTTLQKYQWVAGGYLIEDAKWIIEKGISKRFKLDENDVILSNTLLYYDDETNLFMDNIVNYLINFIDTSKFCIKYKVKQDELLDLTFVVIFVRKLE